MSGTFSPFSSCILLLVLPGNFIFSSVKSSRKYSVLILEVILFSILFVYMHMLIEGLTVFALCFFNIFSK